MIQTHKEEELILPRVAHTYTAENTVISPNFLMWKFCGKVQSPRNSTETAPFPKIFTPGN